MTRGSVVALVAIALAAGLALRFARLDVRPMHHDEANQAVKFGALLERGEYRYDAHDHHGPTLYYLTLPAAAIRGQTTFASLDERTIRGVTAAFGAATILLLPLLTPGIGRTAVAASAWLLALSPAMVFYSRMFIQEALLVCFTLAFAVAIGRATTRGGVSWAILAGSAAGLAAATKETSALIIPAALAACGIAWWSLRTAWEAGTHGPGTRRLPRTWVERSSAVLVVVGTAGAIAVMFYTSFFTAPAGVLDPLRAIATYIDRGVTPASHVHPWHYYLGLLAYSSTGGLQWSEALVLVLAAIGATGAWRAPDARDPARAFWTRYLTAYTLITMVVFSAIRYKTPWNLLPFYAGVIVLGGIGFSAVVHAFRARAARLVLVSTFALGAAHLGWQAWRASVTYAADPRNPYVYAQTVPDAVRMATRIAALAAMHPEGAEMQVSVVAPPHEQWPLPWYLRAMPYVGYWTAPDDRRALDAPVVVASLEHADALDATLGERYVSEFYGLRPDVLLTLYIERGLWDRFLAARSGGTTIAP